MNGRDGTWDSRMKLGVFFHKDDTVSQIKQYIAIKKRP